MKNRKDSWTALVVDMALRALPFDRQHACRILAHGAVPIEVARRVLLRPDQRRAAK